MNFLNKLEKHFGGWAIPNLTVLLLAVQLIGFLMLKKGLSTPEDLALVGGLVQNGEWTRLFSFMMIPPAQSLFWLFFACYIFYIMGSALEREWGAFRYNMYILLGYLFTITAAMLAPASNITNTYFLGGIFLAFATLFPNFELNLFFILPVKVKWLGWLTAVLYVLTLLGGGMSDRLCVIAAFTNYLLFFGKDALRMVKADQRRKAYTAEQTVVAEQSLHTCAECGLTDKTDPVMSFRYCSTCGKCYCEKHLSTHEHAG